MSEERACERIGRLRGVTWRWRPEAPDGLAGEDMGVIAQEVEAVLPMLVGSRVDGTLFVDYAGIVAELLAAIIELDERLVDMEATAAAGKQTGPSACALIARMAPSAPADHGCRGLDAQRVGEILPAAVRSDDHGPARIAHHTLVAPLIEAVKELDARLGALSDVRSPTAREAGPR